MAIGLSMIIAMSKLRVDIIMKNTHYTDPTAMLLESLLDSTVVIHQNDQKIMLKTSDILLMSAISGTHIIKIRTGKETIKIDARKLIEKKLSPLFKRVCGNRCYFALSTGNRILIEYPETGSQSPADYFKSKGFEVKKIVSSSIILQSSSVDATATISYVEIS